MMMEGPVRELIQVGEQKIRVRLPGGIDALPPLLTPEETGRFEEWRLAEKERQKKLSASSGRDISKIFA